MASQSIDSRVASTATGSLRPENAWLRTDILRDDEAFRQLEDEWNGLVARLDSATIFATFDWHYTWWKHHRQGRSLFIITVRDAGKLVAVGPFCLHRIGSRLAAATRLEFLGTKSSDVCDIAVDPYYLEATERLFAKVIERQNEWDLVDWWQVPEWSPLINCFEHWLLDDDLFRSKTEQTIERVFAIGDGGWKRALNKGFLSNTKRRREGITRVGTLEFGLCGDETEIEPFLGELGQIHIRRWRLRQEASSFLVPSHRAWLIDIARQLYSKGHLYLSQVRLNGEVIAVGLYFLYRRRLTSYVYSFDIDYARYSLGSILAWETIEDCEKKGLADIFDWGEGTEHYKSMWTKEYFTLNRMNLVKRRGIRSRLMFSWSLQVKPSLQRQERFWIPLRRMKTQTKGMIQRLKSRTVNVQ